MSKHKPETYTTSELLDRIWNHEDPSAFPDLIGSDGEPAEGIDGKFWALDWPDHCVTTQHLGDATIHGPFECAEDADACCRPL